MSVNAKERVALEKMWDESKASGGADLPDGDYVFLIVKAKPNMSDKGMPSFQSVVRVVDGAEAFVGQEVPVRDNLGSADNMGWFKKKLARLGIEIPAKDEMIRQLMNKDDGEGSVAAAMVGKKFSGQCKTKNDFMNIYVNKLLGTEEVEAAPAATNGAAAKGKAAAASDDETDSGDDKIEVDDTVKFVSKNDGDQQGVVLELLEGGKVARVQATDDDGKTYEGKIYKLPAERLTIVYEDGAADETTEESETEEETEEAPAKGKAAAKGKAKKAAFPTRAEIEDMRLPDLKETLGEHGFDTDDIKAPRQFATGVAGFIEDGKDYQPELAELPALCAALEVKYKKGEAPKAAIKALRETIEERFA